MAELQERQLELSGRPCRIVGDAGDPYFGALQGIADDLAPLGAWAHGNLPRDAVVVDAGGNIGLTALLLSTVVPEGQVHVFEALPSNFSLLKQNLVLNDRTNCTTNEVALGDHVGSIVMHGTGSASHVAADYSTRRVERGAIPMTTIDTYVSDRSLHRLDFIKIDVEGFEPAVLEGASGAIERFRPVIWMEFNSWCLTYVQGFHARDFANSLWHAFDVTVVDRGGRELAAGDGSATRFLHDNVVLHGTVDDVLLRLKPGARVPAKGSVAPPPPDPALVRHVKRLEEELAAIRASTSWRLTSPIRGVGRVIDGLRRPRTEVGPARR